MTIIIKLLKSHKIYLPFSLGCKEAFNKFIQVANSLLFVTIAGKLVTLVSQVALVTFAHTDFQGFPEVTHTQRATEEQIRSLRATGRRDTAVHHTFP